LRAKSNCFMRTLLPMSTLTIKRILTQARPARVLLFAWPVAAQDAHQTHTDPGTPRSCALWVASTNISGVASTMTLQRQVNGYFI
jgi:hypothetical protein